MTCPCECHGHGPGHPCSIEGGCGSVGCDYLDRPEHRCASGDHCKGRTPQRRDDGTPTGMWLAATIATARGLCDRCLSDVTHAINHLTGDVVELTMMLGRIVPNEPGDIVTYSPTLKIPLQVNLEALRAEIDSELQSWVEPVAEMLGIDWDTDTMRRSRLAVRVQRAAHLLAQAVDTLVGLPDTEHPAWADGLPVWDHDLGCQDTTVRDGVDAGLHMIELHRRAYAALGRSRLVHRLPTPCPWCDVKMLVRNNGEDHVECENCHKVIPERHYSWLVSVLVREQQRARTAA